MDINKAKEIFEIEDDYNLETLKERLKKLSLANHPDYGGDNDKMREILEAYKILKNIYLEKNYDGSSDNLPATIDQSESLVEIINHKINESEVNTSSFNKDDLYEVLDTLFETEDFRILKDVNPRFLNDPYFMNMAIDIVPESIYYASDELKKNPNFILGVFETNSDMIFFADSNLKEDKDFILRALEVDPIKTLEFANVKYRKDKDVMKKAVSINGLAYKYASFELQNDEEILSIALNQNGEVVNSINPTVLEQSGLLSNPKFVLLAIDNEQYEIVMKSDEKLWSDEDFVYKALMKDDLLFEKVDKRLFEKADFMKRLIEENSFFTQFIGENLKNDPSFASYCVSIDGMNLKYFSADIKDNKEIVEQALGNNVDSFKYALPGLALNDEFLRKISEKFGMGENKSLYEEKKYLQIVIESNGVLAWEKAKDINPYAFDIDILVNLLRNADTVDLETIYQNVKRQRVVSCPSCHESFYIDRITVNGEKKVEKEKCSKCLDSFFGNIDVTDKTLVATFDFEYNLAKRNYVNFNNAQADYIIKRAEEMGTIDFNILNYFPEDRKKDSNYMKSLSDRFGIKVVNYYIGESKGTFAAQCVKTYGIECLHDLSPEYFKDEDFMTQLVMEYGSDVLKYSNLSAEQLQNIKDKINKINEIENLKNDISNLVDSKEESVAAVPRM
jgi:curved DNA-binding protein CbpA